MTAVHQLQGEPGNDETENAVWTEARAKGCRLVEMMKASDADAGKMFKEPMDSARSKFTFDDLDKWGYDGIPFPDDYYDFDGSYPIKGLLEALEVDTKKHTEGGKNFAFAWEHEHERTIDGVVYKPTGGRFNMILNPKDGVIIVIGAYAPWYEGKTKEPPVTVFPKLSLSSDIIFLQYSHLADYHKDIRYIIQANISNDKTAAVAKKALFNAGEELNELLVEKPSKLTGEGPRKLPGKTFYTNTPEGEALLGTPNGVGGAYMLIQHKEELGLKIIDKVTVFYVRGTEGWISLWLLFHVTDVNKKELET